MKQLSTAAYPFVHRSGAVEQLSADHGYAQPEELDEEQIQQQIENMRSAFVNAQEARDSTESRCTEPMGTHF